jgi:hypothetical protein
MAMPINSEGNLRVIKFSLLGLHSETVNFSAHAAIQWHGNQSY